MTRQLRPEHTLGHGPYHPDYPSSKPPGSKAQEDRPCDHAYVERASRGGFVFTPGGRNDPTHVHCWHGDEPPRKCCTCGKDGIR